MTWHDHARCQLSVFTREEAGAIVAYLEYKRDADSSQAQRRRNHCGPRQLLARPSCQPAPRIKQSDSTSRKKPNT